MKIKDFFRKPIATCCSVQGVEQDVLVEVDYQPPEECADEQAEVTEVRNLRGVSIMGDIFMADLEELEDRLLAMAHSEHEARVEDAREFARELQAEALAMGRMQRSMLR